MKLLAYMEMSQGGIADYAHAQTSALVDRGVEVEMLASPDFLETRVTSYPVLPALQDWRRLGTAGPAIARKAGMALRLLGNFRTLAKHVTEHPYDAVLMHFSEYLAPLWAWRLRRLRDRGVHFVSVLHDPQRDYQLGPKWWHERSVREAFSFLDLALVHTRSPIDLPGLTEVKWIPHGNYQFPPPVRSRSEVRSELGVPEGATLAISYGFLRDNKNLDLGIKAVSDMPGIHLLIAGRELSQSNKPVIYYQQLAERLGCADRCHWLNRFISQQETADLLSASDVLLLTYSQNFVSWSGVLSLAVNYRLPGVVSGGDGTMGSLVQKYRIGVSVEPDSVDEIRRGLAVWKDDRIHRDWDGFRAEISWERNAELVEDCVRALGDGISARRTPGRQAWPSAGATDGL